MESSAWPKNLSSSSKRAIQELCGQNPKKLRDAFDAHSQTGDDPWQPLFAEDLISVLGSFSNTQSLSSGVESYEVSQVPGNVCVMSGVSEGSKSVETPFRRFQMSPVESVETPSQGSSSPTKPKTHECSICGLEFAIGQALGGHMRRHRAAMSEGARTATATAKAMAMAMAPPPCPLAQISAVSRALQAPVVKKTNSGRVLWLDLNLTPMENESDLEFRFMTKTPAPPPVIDCYVV